YTVVPAARVLRIPEGVSNTAAAMAEPLACVVHAIDDCSRIRPGDRVLVSGPGSIGLMALQVARAAGAEVLVSGTAVDAERLDMALALGAARVVCVPGEDLAAAVRDFTGGTGVDAVLECSGAARAIDAALPLVKKRGYFTQIGLPGKKIEFDIEKVCYRELKFSGSLGSRRDSWIRALALTASGAVRLEPLVTSRRPITEWQAAFEDFESKTGIKQFLTPVG
ncbi:MAG TPA: zinc-binding dehydrogenase, partial [Clostridia bacterium]